MNRPVLRRAARLCSVLALCASLAGCVVGGDGGFGGYYPGDAYGAGDYGGWGGGYGVGPYRGDHFHRPDAPGRGFPGLPRGAFRGGGAGHGPGPGGGPRGGPGGGRGGGFGGGHGR